MLGSMMNHLRGIKKNTIIYICKDQYNRLIWNISTITRTNINLGVVVFSCPKVATSLYEA